MFVSCNIHVKDGVSVEENVYAQLEVHVPIWSNRNWPIQFMSVHCS